VIIFPTRYAIVGEALFGEPIGEARVDLVRHLQRPARLAHGACTRFTTIHIDLARDESAVLADIKKGTRYEIRRAEQDGVVCVKETTSGLDEFREFFRRFAMAKGIAVPPEAQIAAYAQQGVLALSSARAKNGDVVVWHAHLVAEARARLLMSATADRGDDKAQRAAIGRANRLLHWNDIRAFRTAGCTTYDLGGWEGESPNPELRGISRFKEEFGGRVVEEYNCVEPRTIRGHAYLLGERLLGRAAARGPRAPAPTPMSLLRCPDDRGSLSATPDHLQCAICATRYPIAEGIVRFVTDAGIDSDDKRSEMRARDDEAEHYDARFSAVRNAIEIPTSLAALSPHADDVVAELGCGSGRMTLRYVERVAAVVAIDFSLSSLRVLHRNLPAALRDRVVLVQADICRPPLAAGMFSKVASFQVFEHLPTPEMRLVAFRGARQLLRSGGTFTLSVYNWNWNKQRLIARGIGDNTAKEGFHDGAHRVYYFNFEPDDLRELFEQSGLALDLLRGLDAQFPGIDRVGRAAVAINRLIERTSLGRRLGHLLLARGHAV
jgi:SAM-dependent methyltransferase